MTDTARLVIAVDSSGAAKATANLDKLDRAAGNSERAANKFGKAWGVAVGLISSAVILGATRAFIRQADAMANMNAKLKLVTGSTIAATAAQRDLFDLSQKTSADLEATTDLYVKLGQSSKDLAGNHALLLGITEKVSKALVISGADAAASTAVIRQFSQAMAAGSLRGDEFISVMEGAPRLARAIADGMGVAVGSLRSLAAQGKLTSAEIIKALEDQGATLDKEFGEMPLTVSRATQQVRNALTEMIGDTEKTSGATKGLAERIAELARLLESDEVKSGFASIVGGLVAITEKVVAAAAGFANFAHWVGEAAARAAGFTAGDDVTGVQDRLSAVKKVIADRSSDPTARFTGVIKGIVTNDTQYAQLADMTDAQLQAEMRKLEAYVTAQEELARITQQAKQDDYAKYRGLDPKFGLNVNPGGSSAAASSSKATTAALAAQNKEKEKALTLDEQWAILEAEVYDPAYVEQQNKLATAWADQGKAVEQATDKMSVFADQAARNIQSSLGDSLYEILGGKFDSIADRFSDMLRRIAAEAASAKIFEMLGTWASGYTGAGAGWINALGKAATSMSGGRAGGGPVMAGQSYWVGDGGKRELFTPSQNGSISQGGGAVTVKAGDIHLEVINKGEPAQAQVSQQKQPDGSQLIRLVLSAVGDSFSSGSGAPYMAAKQRFALKDAV